MATRSSLKHAAVKESAGSNKQVTFATPTRNFAATDGTSSNGGPKKQYAKSHMRPSSDNYGSECQGQKRGSGSAPMARESPSKRRREGALDGRSVAEKTQDVYTRAMNLENDYAELAQKTSAMTEQFAGVVSLQKSLVFRHTGIDRLKWAIEQKLVAKKNAMTMVDEQIENAAAAKKRLVEALSTARRALDTDV